MVNKEDIKKDIEIEFGIDIDKILINDMGVVITYKGEISKKDDLEYHKNRVKISEIFYNNGLNYHNLNNHYASAVKYANNIGLKSGAINARFKPEDVTPPDEFNHDHIIKAIKKVIPKIFRSNTIKGLEINPSKVRPEDVEIYIQLNDNLDITDEYNTYAGRIRNIIASLSMNYSLDNMSIIGNGLFFVLKDKDTAIGKFTDNRRR